MRHFDKASFMTKVKKDKARSAVQDRALERPCRLICFALNIVLSRSAQIKISNFRRSILALPGKGFKDVF